LTVPVFMGGVLYVHECIFRRKRSLKRSAQAFVIEFQ